MKEVKKMRAAKSDFVDASVTVAPDDPPKPDGADRAVSGPMVVLTGPALDRLLLYLNTATVLVKGQTGAMHPFVDPMPILQILQAATIQR
jgi:hypothetical protein